MDTELTIEEGQRIAGEYQSFVENLQDEVEHLKAQSDSLRVAFDAISSENQYLRNRAEKAERSRDNVIRERDLLKAAFLKTESVLRETRQNIAAPQQKAIPQQPTSQIEDFDNVAFIDKLTNGTSASS